MTRISTYAHSQTLLSHMLRNQQDMTVANEKVSTGKKAGDFKGYAQDASALLSARNLGGRIQSYLDSNRELETLLAMQDNALHEISSIADDVRNDLITAVNLSSGVGLADKLEGHLDRLINALNTKFNGRFLFSGTRGDTSPINVANTTDLLALGSTAAAFDNNAIKMSQRIDDTQTMEYGILAQDVAEDLLNVLRRTLQFENGTLPTGAGAYTPAGAYQDPMPANQRDFLVSEFSNAITAQNTARQYVTSNGVNMSVLDKGLDRQAEDLTFVKQFIGKIENADIAEAVSELKSSEAALTASMQVIARVGSVSLLDFL